MKKQGLTFYEMKDLGDKYLFRTIVPSILGISLLFLGISFLTTNWKIVGWTMVAIAIGCIVSVIVFFKISSYWYRKAFEPPQWLVKADAKWRETHKQ